MSFKTIGDYAKIQGGFAYKSQDFKKSGYPVIKIKNIGFGRIRYNDLSYVSKEIMEKTKSYLTSEEDILISMTGSNVNQPESIVGRVALVTKYDTKFLINQRVGRLVFRTPQKINNKYLFYVLSQKDNQYYLALNASGSANQVNINSKLIESIKFRDVSLEDSNKIVHILSTLDNKIELNKKINQTLESIAQTIFKSWFVDFDPVHAKANANSEDEYDTITKELGISREILDLFPSEFEESELGLIPKGWRPTKIENYIEILDSKRVPLSKNEREKRKGSIPYYGATSIMDYIDDFLFDEPLTLIGEDGSVVKEDGTPFTQYIWGKSWVNNHAHVLRAKKNLSTEGIYILFKDTNVSSYVTGAVQPKINQNNLKRIPILEPCNHLYDEFSKLINPLFSMVRIRTDETLQLCKLRNYLLPKLLSGEIDVSSLNLEPEND